MRVYQLFVKMGRRWNWLCDLNAASHADAFREAMLRLEPEHFDKQIRLEESHELPMRHRSGKTHSRISRRKISRGRR